MLWLDGAVEGTVRLCCYPNRNGGRCRALCRFPKMLPSCDMSRVESGLKWWDGSTSEGGVSWLGDRSCGERHSRLCSHPRLGSSRK